MSGGTSVLDSEAIYHRACEVGAADKNFRRKGSGVLHFGELSEGNFKKRGKR